MQTLGAVLVPQYLAKLPHAGHTGAGLPGTAEVWATRPVIHTEGSLAREPEQRGESAGTRVHPQMALLLFQWLLDEEPDCPFRLYHEAEERVGGVTEKFFRTLPDAKERLSARTLALSEVHYRTVRAYTRPVAVYVNTEGVVVIQKMTAKAKRNYERFVLDAGRVLDFNPVEKTYVMLTGEREVLSVPRTFNQGSFSSLADVLTMVPDAEVKQRARERFRE